MGRPNKREKWKPKQKNIWLSRRDVVVGAVGGVAGEAGRRALDMAGGLIGTAVNYLTRPAVVTLATSTVVSATLMATEAPDVAAFGVECHPPETLTEESPGREGDLGAKDGFK